MPRLPLREIVRLFLHLGITAYGGLAMVEPMRRRVVEEKGWISQGEFLDGLALCQMVPGATVVQLATYVGYRLREVTIRELIESRTLDEEMHEKIYGAMRPLLLWRN
jgi:chromate transport protein ChrA